MKVKRKHQEENHFSKPTFPALRALIMLFSGDDKCCLPSCRKELDARYCESHHGDFFGDLEPPILFPKIIHLACPYCHYRLHLIAAKIILCMEQTNVYGIFLLILSVVLALNESYKNVEFVLFGELESHGIIEINQGKIRLKDPRDIRLKNIKKYLDYHSPELSFEK